MKLKHLHYSWVMVIIAVCIQTAFTVPLATFGVFLIPLTTEFNWDRGALSVAVSIFMLIMGFFGIFSGRLSDKYGPRPLVTITGLLIGIGFLLMSQISSLGQIYIIWGLVISAGAATCFIPIMSTIPKWFAKKRGIAVGITFTGIGLGGLIGPLLAQWLLSSYGWKQAYVILGLIASIIIIPLAQFMKHSPQRIGLRPYGEDGTIEDTQSSASIVGGLSFRQAIRTDHFWLYGLTLFCFFFAISVINVHIAPYAVDVGFSAMTAASLLSMMHGGSVIGRFSMGFISDKIGPRRALTACLVTVTLALAWLLFAQGIWMLYVFAVLFGIAYGGIATLLTLVPTELFGLGFLGIIFGAIRFFGTIGEAVGPFLAGSIFDVTGSYRLALLTCVIFGVLATILSLVLLRARGLRGGD
ncbi:MFS transporter [Chloroflexota bacterium]